MKKDFARETAAALTPAFAEKHFLQLLTLRQTDVRRLLRKVDWPAAVRSLLPIRARLSCADVLELCRPMLDAAASEPEEGWLHCAYQTVCALQFPRMAGSHTPAQRDAALLYLQALQVLLDDERSLLHLDPLTDFAFCTDEELTGSMVEKEYRAFLAAFREGYVYEMLRLGRETSPFRTLDHIAGVHHVSMTVARFFAALPQEMAKLT